MKNFNARGLLAVIILSAALAGCGAQDKPREQPGNVIEQPTPPADESKEIKVEREVAIYAADTELTKSVERKVKLLFLEDEPELEIVKTTLNELQKDGIENEVSLWKAIPINSVKLENGLVTIDIHLPDEARLGAPGESLVIETMKQTLFQFDFVQSIELLVDGAAVETLMGHVELEHPYTKE